jgi:hypothetical protein
LTIDVWKVVSMKKVYDHLSSEELGMLLGSLSSSSETHYFVDLDDVKQMREKHPLHKELLDALEEEIKAEDNPIEISLA